MPIVLGNNVLDDLLGVVDELRLDLHANFGTREYKVFLVTRTYTGLRKTGTYSTVSTEIVPPPKLESTGSSQFSMLGGGKQPVGDVVASLISLQISEDELLPSNLNENQEFLWQVQDNHGENIRTRYFKLKGKPVPDRHKHICWIVTLTEISLSDDSKNGV